MRISGLKRYAYVFLAFLQAGLTSGIIYGWPALESIFIKEGIFRDKCSPDDPITEACKGQKSLFNLIYTVGVFVNNAAPLVTGVLLDSIGPKWTNLGSAGLFFVGCGLFALPWHYAKIPGFAILGLAGPGIYCSIMHLCNLFPGHQSSVLSFFSGTFSASGFIFKVFELIYKQERYRDIPSIFIEYIIIIAPCFILGAFIWPNKAFSAPGTKSMVDADAEETPLMGSKKSVVIDKRPTLYNVSPKKQFLTLQYWVPVMWLALASLSISCYLGTIQDRFPTGNLASVFNYVWSFGWVSIPLFGLMMDYYGNYFSRNFASVGLVVFCVLKLIPNNDVQYATFVTIACVNVGMWAIFYSYISDKFGFDNYGKLLGVSSITVASIGALQYAFDYATDNTFHGNYKFADIVFMCTSVVCLFLSLYMWFTERMNKKQVKMMEHYPPPNIQE